MSVIWLIGWIFLIYDSPRSHPRISKAEINYIECSLVEVGGTETEVSVMSIDYIKQNT